MRGEQESKINHLAARVTSWVLFAILATQVTFLVKDVRESWQQEPDPVRHLKITRNKPPTMKERYTSLDNFEMFGSYIPDTKTVLENLPSTKLPVYLQAIFFKPKQNTSRVLVDAGQGTKLVSVGDEILADVLVHQIHRNGVTIRRKESFERLELDRIELDGIEIKKKSLKLSDYMSSDMLAYKQKLEKERKRTIEQMN